MLDSGLIVVESKEVYSNNDLGQKLAIFIKSYPIRDIPTRELRRRPLRP